MAIALNVNSVNRFMQSSLGRKLLKYTAGSGISAAVSQVAFIASFGVFHLFGSRGSSIAATLIGAIPSYFLNRNWAWQKKSRSSLSREVVPYFIVAVLGLVFSTWSADFANSHSYWVGSSHVVKVLFVSGAYFGAFAVLWVAKFAFLNKYLFAPEQENVLQEAMAVE